MKYQIADYARQLCEAFEIDPVRVAKRADLPGDFLTDGGRLVSAPEYYDLWDAVDVEAQRPDLPLQLAYAVLEHGFDSSVYSFFSSPTVRIGLERKALFKPLIAPVEMSVLPTSDGLSVEFGSVLPDRPLPALMGWFDLAYFVLSIRHATGAEVAPTLLEAVGARGTWDAAQAFFGQTVGHGTVYRLMLSAEDAARPLISRNDALWAELERGLNQRFATQVPPTSIAARVRQALVEGLPGGQSSADQISRALAMSKRSLQRRLAEEDANFKDILEDTRRALALNYLQNSDMSVQEIAYLLGFRDPTSFFRAFRGWTGKTPQAARQAMG